MNLNELGWNNFFDDNFNRIKIEGQKAARVTGEQRNLYRVMSEDGELTAEVSGKLRYRSQSRADFPAVGDWVVIEPVTDESKAVIRAVLPRKSAFSRKAVLSGGMPDTGGKTDEQILAANIDTVFLVSGLDGDFNIRRIERYVTIAWDSGATPVIVLNKIDLCDDLEATIEQVETVVFGVDILPVSATDGAGLEEINAFLSAGRTAVFLGSSGVGKSSIINALLGEERLKVQAVRDYDKRGRHTTTHREMIVIPGGGIVIDTPGLREIQIWLDEEGIKRTFPDIEALAMQCRFSDCRHQTEPGCAVKAAIKNGELDEGRYNNYLKLQKELEHLARRQNQKEARRSERDFDKRIRQILKERENLKKRGLI